VYFPPQLTCDIDEEYVLVKSFDPHHPGDIIPKIVLVIYCDTIINIHHTGSFESPITISPGHIVVAVNSESVSVRCMLSIHNKN
jgi:hypothetical protein